MSIIERIERGEYSLVRVYRRDRGLITSAEAPDAQLELLTLARAGEKMRWIPVSERLPVIDYTKPKYARYVNCLAVSQHGFAGCLRFVSNGYAKTEKGRLPRWERESGRVYAGEVLYWLDVKDLPLPEPPKEEA